MKVVVKPLQYMARPDALTSSEWEGLARAAVVIETEASKEEFVFVTSDADVDNENRRLSVTRIVVGVLKDCGLQPGDWYVLVSPHMLDRVPVPVYFDNWYVDLRLKRQYTTAKAKELETKTKESFAPTLAEQHGKAKKND